MGYICEEMVWVNTFFISHFALRYFDVQYFLIILFFHSTVFFCRDLELSQLRCSREFQKFVPFAGLV